MRVIERSEWLRGATVSLRLCDLTDCTPRYVAWLADPEVNRYLETRWREQTVEDVCSFVASMLESSHSYLFAIIVNASNEHIGNVKVGPVIQNHRYADVSYFIGERSAWGRGYATEAVRLATEFGFDRLDLHRLQAGLYESNVGSRRVLEKSGYVFEGRLANQLLGKDGWEDHLWFGALRESWGVASNPR